MKVAIVDWDVAYPMDSGKRLRTANLMMALSDRHDLTYVSRGSDQTDEGVVSREFLADHNIQTAYLDSPVPPKSGPMFWARLVRNIGQPVPYAVAAHQDKRFLQCYRAFAKQNHFDVWQFEWPPYAQMLRDVVSAPRVITAHNVDTLIYRRYAATDTRRLHRKFFEVQASRVQAYEQQAFGDADAVIAVSEPDAEWIREHVPHGHVRVVDNGVDLDRYDAIGRDPQRAEFLFLGSLDWRPNQDAISVLLREVFPKLRTRVPDATLSIVGRRPSASLIEAVGTTDGVQLHADVPDVAPFLRRATAMVIPLRIGGGSRLKMIEAMAAKVPVIASTVAAEGLKVTAGQDFCLADSPDVMAEAMARGCEDADWLSRLAEAAHRTAKRHYGWDQLGKKLESVWLHCLGGDAQGGESDRDPIPSAPVQKSV